MVMEMHKTRTLQVLPRVALSIDHFGAGNAFFRITNAGPGAALEVAVSITLGPDGPSRQWSHPLLMPGDVVGVIPDPSAGTSEGSLNLNVLTTTWESVAINGQCLDALGERHPIQERIDIREFWAHIKEAQVVLEESDSSKIAKALEKIEKHLHKVVSWVTRFRTPTEPYV
jgi:hypothetical protein